MASNPTFPRDGLVDRIGAAGAIAAGHATKRGQYDAFISYSRAADGRLGPAIQSGLRRLARPIYRAAAMRVFRDATNLAVNSSLWAEIEQALSSSRYFILLASPGAAQSKWVQKEVSYWLKNRSPKTLLIALTAGSIGWNPAVGDFDWEQTNAVPRDLAGAYLEEPNYADFSWVRDKKDLSLRSGRFATEVARLAAAIHNRPLEDLFGEERRQKRLMKRVATLVLSVVVAAIAFGGWQWYAAETEQQVALSQKLVNNSGRVLDSQPDLSLLLSVEATRVRDAPETRGSLLTALQKQPALVRYLHEHKRSELQPSPPVTAVALSRDGRIAVSGDESGRIMFWDLASQREVPPALKQQKPVTALAVSVDGSTLASGAGNTVLLWDIRNRKRTGGSLEGHSASVNAVDFSADDNVLASGSSDGTVALWDPHVGKPVGSPIKAEMRAIFHIAFSPDGALLAAGGEGVRLLDPRTQAWKGPVAREGIKTVFGLAFSLDGKSLAIASSDGSVNLRDVASGENHSLPGRMTVPLGITFVAGDTVLIAADNNGRLRRWDMQTRHEINSEWRASTSPVRSIAANRRHGTFLTGNHDGTVVVWDANRVDTVSMLLPGEHIGGVSDVTFTAGGDRLISGGYDDAILLWDIATKREIASLVRGHHAVIQSVAVSPDGALFAFKDGKRVVGIGKLDASSSGPRSIEGHHALSNLVFAQRGKTLVFGTNEGVVFWDVVRGDVSALAPLPNITNVAFAAAANVVAASDRDGTITLLNAQTGEAIQPPMRHGTNVLSLAFGRNGELLASAGEGGTVVVWDVAGRRELWRNPSAHGQEASVVAFSPDGSMLASGGGDGSLALWDVSTFRRVGWLVRDQGGSIDTAQFGPDGKLLAAGGQDGRIRLWDVDLVAWKRHACHIANRELTPNEWSSYVDGERQSTCGTSPRSAAIRRGE